MRIAVFGATGGTGQQLVRQALDAGHKVTAVVRNPERLPVRHNLLDVVTADVTDPEALRPAVTGSDVALSALGAPANKSAGIASRGTRVIVRALEAEGVRRFLAVSAVPVGPDPAGEGVFYRAVLSPLVRRTFKDVYADLTVMEEVIGASALDWTVVRPPKLTNGPLTGEWQRRFGEAVPRRHTISRADVADAMLGMAGEAEAVNKVVCVAG